MRKIHFSLVCLLVMLAVVLPATSPTRSENKPNAGPEFPFPLVGIVQYKGFNLAACDSKISTCTDVKAYCGTYTYSFTTVQIDPIDGKSWYSMNIPGDDPVTVGVKEGCELGEPISFTIKGESAEQGTSWQVVTENYRQDISFGSPNFVFLPMVRR